MASEGKDEGGRPGSPSGSVYSWTSERSDTGDGDDRDEPARMAKPSQMEVLAGLAKAGGDVDEYIAPADAEGGAGGEGKEREEVDDVDIALKTAVLSLPAAPLMSLRDILEREDDPSAAENTVSRLAAAQLGASIGPSWLCGSRTRRVPPAASAQRRAYHRHVARTNWRGGRRCTSQHCASTLPPHVPGMGPSGVPPPDARRRGQGPTPR